MTTHEAVSKPTNLAAPAPEAYLQLGQITRQLHEALNQLGLMPELQRSANGLPDMRARLGYVVSKTGAAADKVLDLVEQARVDRARIADASHGLVPILETAALTPGERSTALAATDAIDAASARLGDHLNEIMMAQDFHDLTGQVVAKVVTIATDLEASLVKLLLQVTPAESGSTARAHELHGPVLRSDGRQDVATNQGEVDDLLASLGF